MEDIKSKNRDVTTEMNSYYSSILNAWIDNRMELDRTLITLSTAGIGILVTIILTVGIYTYWLATLYALSIVSFALCLFFCLKIYATNTDYLKALIDEYRAEDKERYRKLMEEKESKLKRYDRFTKHLFFTGIVVALIIGISTGYSMVHNMKEETMKDRKDLEKTEFPGRKKTDKKSLEGLDSLRPDIIPGVTPGEADNKPDTSGSDSDKSD